MGNEKTEYRTRQLSLDFGFTVTPCPVKNEEGKKNKSRDLYNLRLLSGLSADGIYDLPSLQPYMPKSISRPLAFHEARAMYGKCHSLHGCFIHFYIDDVSFECVRRSPERYVNLFKSADFIIAPDYSTYANYPLPVLLRNAYDNQLIAAYMQRKGVNVVANAIWGRPIFYNMVFSGQPHGGAIAVSSNALRLSRKKDVSLWLHGYAEAISRLSPALVLRFGKTVGGEHEIYPEAIQIETENKYIKRIRNYGR